MVAVAVAIFRGNVTASTLVDLTRAIAYTTSVQGAHTIVLVVANAIHVDVSGTIATALANGIFLIAVAVAIARRRIGTTAFVNRAGTVANATRVNHANAVIFVVTNAIHVVVGKAVTTAVANGILLVAIAVTIAFRDVCAAARIDLTGAIAHATRVQRADAVIHVITNAIGIGVCRAVTTTNAQGVELVAVAVTIAFRNVCTSTLVNCSRTVANPALVECTHAIVYVVANAVGICVCVTIAAANTNGVELVAVAVTIANGDVCTSAFVNLTWAVAYATCIQRSDTVVHVVTNAVGISVCFAVTAAHAQGVKLVAITVAIAFGDVCTSAFINRTRTVAKATLVELTHASVYVVANAIGIGVGGAVSITNAECVKLVAVAVAIAFRDVCTSAFVNLTWAVAYATCIQRSDTVVLVVTDAVSIGVGGAVTTTHAQSVELISVTVAISFRNVSASTIVNGTRAIANPASVERAYAIVHIVTNPVGIGVFRAVTTTHAKGVELVAIAIAIAFGNVCTSTLVNLPRTVANSAFIQGSHAVIHVVTKVIAIGVGGTVATTFPEGIFHVSFAITSILSDPFTATNAAFVQNQAAVIIFCGICVEIASGLIRTARDGAGVELNHVSPFVLLRARRKDLNINLARQGSFSGDLHHENFQIWTCKALMSVGLVDAGKCDKPSATCFVIHREAGTKSHVI